MKPRTAAIIIPALALIVAAIWRIAVSGRTRRLQLLALTADEAYHLGYSHGCAGVAGYWPEYECTDYDDVPGVGRVWRASTAEGAYWHGWYDGEAKRERNNR